ncbi:MAG: tetratricopeptide repeat protein [Acidimicrobiales bacterium]
MIIDVTDETLEAEVLNRSLTTPVVVDLWAPWCGPCKTLGPMIEAAVTATGGRVALAKINVDENPAASQAFKVQSIPAVFAISGGKIVDQFVGALPEDKIIEFVNGLLAPSEPTEIDRLREAGDEASLRQALALEADNADVIIDLAELLAGENRGVEALELLAKIPETSETRRIAAYVRSGSGMNSEEQIEDRLAALLASVKDDDQARQEFIDLLDLLGAEHERTSQWRRKLTTTLF